MNARRRATDQSLTYPQLRALAERINVPDGGFSVRAYGKDAGRNAVEGYLVGGIGTGQKISYENETHYKTDEGPVSPEAISSYVHDNLRYLKASDRYLGGWNDTANSAAYLDVSQRFTPRTRIAERSALRAMIERNEVSMGEVDSDGNHVASHYNPFHSGLNAGDVTVPTDAATRQTFIDWPLYRNRRLRTGPPVTPQENESKSIS